MNRPTEYKGFTIFDDMGNWYVYRDSPDETLYLKTCESFLDAVMEVNAFFMETFE